MMSEKIPFQTALSKGLELQMRRITVHAAATLKPKQVLDRQSSHSIYVD